MKFAVATSCWMKWTCLILPCILPGSRATQPRGDTPISLALTAFRPKLPSNGTPGAAHRARNLARWLDDQGAEGRDTTCSFQSTMLCRPDSSAFCSRANCATKKLDQSAQSRTCQSRRRYCSCARRKPGSDLHLGGRLDHLFAGRLSCLTSPPDHLHYVLQEYSRVAIVKAVGYCIVQDDGQAKRARSGADVWVKTLANSQNG